MAHLEKYTVAATGRLTNHYERRKYNGEYIKFGNQNIDLSRTPQNYNLAPFRGMSQVDFIRQRTGEVKCMKRQDVNVMCSWVVTAPVGVKENELSEFFRETYSFLERRYGSRNVISAFVHKDEVTPHVHFAFVPVVYDKKKGVYKVSAKELIDRTDLRSFHPDLEQHLADVFGRELGILNEATKEGNRSVEDLKRGTAVERIRDAEEMVKIAEEVYQERIMVIRKVNEDCDRQRRETEAIAAKLDEVNREIEQNVQIRGKLELEINRLRVQVKAEQDKLEHFHNMLDGRALSVREMQGIQPQKTVTGTIKGISLEDISNLKKTGMLYRETLEQLQYSQKRCDWFEAEIGRYRRLVPSIEEKIQAEQNMRELQIFRKILAGLPEPVRQEFLKFLEPAKVQPQRGRHEHER